VDPAVLEPTDPATDPAPRTEPIVGTAPANWNNDDLPGWRPLAPFSVMLGEAAAAGYAGIEYGDGFPTSPDELRRALDERRLTLAGCYRWLPLRDEAALAAELPTLDALLSLLSSTGGQDLVVADAMTPERIAMAGQVPGDGSRSLGDADWKSFGESLRKVAHRTLAHGITTRYHNHVGTFVEAPHEIERLLVELRPGLVDLCFDTGHYAYGGGDPTAFVQAHRDVIGYLHLKDVDPSVLSQARSERFGFLDALKRYIFCEFGEGIVDIPRVIDALRHGNYQGWIIVEQDTTPRSSFESAAASRRYLHDACGI
jgi:inosose dehydratase